MPSHRASRADRRARKLPTWDKMSDLDKGAALRYVYRTSPPAKGHRGAHWDWRHCRRIMECRFFDDPRLTELSPKQSARFARKVTGGQKRIVRTLPKAEYGRLFVIAARRLG